MSSIRAKALKRVLKLSRFLAAPVSDDNLTAKRRAFARLEKYFPAARDVVVEPVRMPGFRGEWISVPESRPDKVILYFHGGGFVFNSTKLHRDLISRIARAGRVKAFSLDYSLAPENRFPQIIAEAMSAYRFLLDEVPAKDIVIVGDSAGGTLVLSVLHQLKKEGLHSPAGTVVIAPPTDATMSNPSFNQPTTDFLLKPENITYFIDSYFGPGGRDHPVASPLHGEFKGFPPLLVHVDKSELLYGDSARIVKKAQEAGVEVEFYEAEDLWHVWHLFARYIPEARVAIDHIGGFIQARTAEQS